MTKRYHLGYPINQSVCQHCWLCGEKTGYDGPCAIHDAECCPERDWSFTYMASVIVPIVHEILSRPVDDYDLHVMMNVADAKEPGDYPWDIAIRAVDIIRSG